MSQTRLHYSVQAEIVTVHVINIVGAIVMITIIISLQSDCASSPFHFSIY